MKKFIAATLFLFTFLAQANSVESFKNVEVNTNGSTTTKVEASVYIISEHPFDNSGYKMAAREVIAITLSSFKAKDLVADGAIETVKYHIFKRLSQNELLSAISITNVYVTDMVVSNVGNVKVKPILIPQKNPISN